MPDGTLTIGACKTCGFIVAVDEHGKAVEPCACDWSARHPNPKCRMRIAATTSTPIECDHGYDVCPTCDPCTCAEVPT